MKKRKVEKFTYTVHTDGDESVGIFPFVLDVTVEGVTLEQLVLCGNGKELLRQELEKFWGGWLDNGKTQVYFEGENL
jgi:hypothetical protein